MSVEIEDWEGLCSDISKIENRAFKMGFIAGVLVLGGLGVLALIAFT